MALSRVQSLVLAGILASSGVASGQDAAPAPTLIPPKALGDVMVPYPVDAPPHDEPIKAVGKLRIDKTGRVSKVTLLEPVPPAFARAFEAAALTFRFEPARYGDAAVGVDIRFTQVFEPPRVVPTPQAEPDARGEPPGPALTARIEGLFRERGTRAPVAGASVVAVVEGASYLGESDAAGTFGIDIPAGQARVVAISSVHRRFEQAELLAANERLRVGYLLDRSSYDPYASTVVGKRRRTEVARTELRGKEITQVPGTFGDPFRVVGTLPGVASVVSLLPFPVVRGASPGSTGFLIDGVRVPLLFHLLAGPSVINPYFIDTIQFFPGGFPVEYGGYTGGIIDGTTRPAKKGETRVEVDLNLFQTGGLVRAPAPLVDGTLTAAGRIGYPGVLLSLLSPEISLSYWDYQLRYDRGTPNNGFTAFVFGASDTVSGASGEEIDAAAAEGRDPNLEPYLELGFHRLDLRYNLSQDAVRGRYQLILGTDRSLAGFDSGGVTTYSVEPRISWAIDATDDVEVRVGLSGTLREASFEETEDMDGEAEEGPPEQLTSAITGYRTGSAYAEVLWRPTERLLVRPGLRSDVGDDPTATELSVDPRLSVRYRATGTDGEISAAQEAKEVFFKGSVGLYHQPPRLIYPLPGLDQLPLENGLLQSIQSSIGLEAPLSDSLSIDTQAFYNDMDPIVFDLSFNDTVEEVQRQAPDSAPGVLPPVEPDDGVNNATAGFAELLRPQKGRSYGLELLLRRRASSGAYGWISYTLSRSERLREGEWVAFDYDRTHLLNLVVGLPLGNGWELGGRLQYQSGTPTTTTAGYNAARVDPYLRFDVRVDKRAVWNEWLLDFYVDVTNATLYPEEIAPGTKARYVLPTVDLRALF